MQRKCNKITAGQKDNGELKTLVNLQRELLCEVFERKPQIAINIILSRIQNLENNHSEK